MKQTTLQLLLVFFVNLVHCQSLVTNGSFELFNRCPNELGDFYPLNWYSIASNSTPDLYSICARQNGSANPNWYYSGVKPFKDSSYVGIVLDEKKTTYREYLGTKLFSKLKEDSTYVFEISIAVPRMSRYTTQSLDIILSEISIFGYDGYTILEETPSFTIDLDSIKTDGTWTRFSFEYTATGNENHLSIGNFKSKKQTIITEIKDRDRDYYKTIYNSTYICIDDVKLSSAIELPEENGEDKEDKEIIVSQTETPKIIHGIQFNTGSAQIENDNIPELEEIVDIMLDDPYLSIEITGYTDNSGNENENKRLSEQRALNVKAYLVELGVSESRISTSGKGSENPIGDNTTEEGKLMNRRIEVTIK